ncbi:MAG: hypothetical protein GY795_22170 [Desulfobacterales bacterium]|nr:hypothetical protein [Desulfobacterales bacterium]
MNDISPNGYIGTNTVIFAQSVIQSIEDMAGISFRMNKSTFREVPFSSSFNMTAFIHFIGTVQGSYIIGINEITAAKLIEIYEHGMTHDDVREMREDFGGFIKELLNLAVGQSILEIEQSFGYLTYTPCTLIYGEIEFPDIMSGDVIIESEFGDIICGFSLDLAKLKIGRKLEETLEELEKKTHEANQAKKEVKTILQLVRSALVAVSSEGRVLPGHSRTAPSVLGYDPEEEIAGADLPTLLKLKPEDIHIFNKFFRLFHEESDLPIEELVSLCEGEFINQEGKTLKLDWVPVARNATKFLEKLLVIIEDVTNKR